MEIRHEVQLLKTQTVFVHYSTNKNLKLFAVSNNLFKQKSRVWKTKMIILQTMQRSAPELGFGLNQRPFNNIQLKYIFTFLTCMIMQFIYLVHVANTPEEFMDVIYIITEGTLATVAYLSTIFQAVTLHIIDERKWFVLKFKMDEFWRIIWLWNKDWSTLNRMQCSPKPMHLWKNWVKSWNWWLLKHHLCV